VPLFLDIVAAAALIVIAILLIAERKRLRHLSLGFRGCVIAFDPVPPPAPPSQAGNGADLTTSSEDEGPSEVNPQPIATSGG
jgi:hypothetical protein